MVSHPRLQSWLRQRVRQVLHLRQRQFQGVQSAVRAAEGQLADLRQDMDALSHEFHRLADEVAMRGQPFSASMTIDQAWRRHPEAPAVFARHHLPACDGCAVRFDETLAEAAEAYGLDLGHLIEALNALL